MQYAALSYSLSRNLGDEIQTLAAMQFLPRVDTILDRDFLGDCQRPELTTVILNGWFIRGKSWPPADNIIPRFISFHVTPEAKWMFSERFRSYYQRFEPIGCRSLYTLEKFRNLGIKAYFSGCLTLTLKRPVGVIRNEKIYLVDVPNTLSQQFIPEEIRRQAEVLRHDTSNRNHSVRLQKARALLSKYAAAKLVVTSRLHAALPCLAFGTPVIFITKDCRNCPRFSGLIDLLRHYDQQDDKIRIDWQNPEPNPTGFEKYRHQLEDTLKESI